MDFCALIKDLAHRQGVRLSPDWSASIQGILELSDQRALDDLITKLQWPAPKKLTDRPRPTQFPFLVYVPEKGWGIAEQWVSDQEIRVLANDDSSNLIWFAETIAYQVTFPELATNKVYDKASDVFWSMIIKRKRMIAEAVIATVILSLLSLMTSFYSIQVYDRVVPHSGFSTLWVLTIGVLIGMLIDLVLRITRSMMIDKEMAGIDAEVSEYFFSRMQDVRLDARPKSIGTMAAQLRGVDQIRQTMTSTTLLIIADLPFALFFIFIIATIGNTIAVVPLIIFILSIILAFIFARMIRGEAELSQASGYSKNGLLVESLDSAETVKANLGGWFMLKKWVHLVDENNYHDMNVKRWSVLASSIFGFLQQFAYIGMVAWGAYRISEGNLTMGGLIGCTIIAGRVNGTLITSLPNLIVQWSYLKSAIKALDAILKLPSDHPQDKQLIKIREISPQLKLSGVKFLHTGARVGLDIPHLDIQPGERVAVIGPVGSGKSSLLRLLAGLYAPQEGHLLLDGLDVGLIFEDDLRRNVFYLPQDYRLVQGTLRDNLTLGLSGQSDEKVIQCAEKTGLLNLIRTHPKGLDLPITEGGQGLSGGQKTLVGLTRLLLSKPKLVLLDEPTAGLDQESELKVLNALVAHLDKETTLIMVTHRMQLLGIFSKLIVMGQGRVLLSGSTKDVIEQLKPKTAQPGVSEVDQTKATVG
jgi:ATP-binding cassette subfamily C protein LapB